MMSKKKREIKMTMETNGWICIYLTMKYELYITMIIITIIIVCLNVILMWWKL